ncbi:MAG: HAMP domain-containing histidine kinase [Pseudomonadales bacterium]|nr:HAMP domain-containing histidine kinase [Pseudomonadales bacterium]
MRSSSNDRIVFLENDANSDSNYSKLVRRLSGSFNIESQSTLPEITNARIYVVEETLLNSHPSDWVMSGELRSVLVEGNPSNLPVRLDGQALLIFWIPVGASAELLSKNLNSIQSLLEAEDQLKRELNEASDIAVLTMGNSSFLGDIIRFMEVSADIQTIQELGEHIVALCDTLRIKANLLIENKTDQFRHFLNPSAKEHLIENRRISQRIIETGRTCQINYPYISLLFEYPQEETGFIDQIKDSLSVLIGEMNQRIFNIQLEQDSMHADKTKEIILATLSHELRTPLHVIHGFSDRLRRKVEGDTLSLRDLAGLESIHDKAIVLRQFLDQQLYLFKLLSGAEPMSQEKFCLRHIVEIAGKDFESKCEEKGLAFRCWSDSGDLEIKTDRDKLMRAITIILDNAVKFTPTGKIDFSCSLKHSETEELAIFKITDTGVGIAPEYITKIFDPFSQQDMSTTRQFGGCGLGLAVASTLLLQLHGSIHAKSIEGEGTSLYISLPISSAADIEVEKQDPQLFTKDVVLF